MAHSLGSGQSHPGVRFLFLLLVLGLGTPPDLAFPLLPDAPIFSVSPLICLFCAPEKLTLRFEMAVCVCICSVMFNSCQLFTPLWLVAHQAPLSMGFSRQEYGSGLSFSSSRGSSRPRLNLCLLHCRWIFYQLNHQGRSFRWHYMLIYANEPMKKAKKVLSCPGKICNLA